jgi:hypothetical protein
MEAIKYTCFIFFFVFFLNYDGEKKQNYFEFIFLGLDQLFL